MRTRRRDVERRFLQGQGWTASFVNGEWVWSRETGANRPRRYTRVTAFSKAIKTVSTVERRFVNRIRRMANA